MAEDVGESLTKVNRLGRPTIAAIYDVSGETVASEDAGRLATSLEGTPVSMWQGPGLSVLGAGLTIGHNGKRQIYAFDGSLDNRPEVVGSLGAPTGAADLSDADIAALAYERWGDACWRRLLGGFTCLAWDIDSRELTAVRGRTGSRGLVWRSEINRVLIASHPRQLLGGPRAPRTLDLAYLACSLTGARPPIGSTMFALTSEVPPGHYLRLSGNRQEVRNYVEAESPQRDVDPQELAARFEDLVGGVIQGMLVPGVLPVVWIDGGPESAYLLKRLKDLDEGTEGAYPLSSGAGPDRIPAIATEFGERLGIRVRGVSTDRWWEEEGLLLDRPDLPSNIADIVAMSRLAKTEGVTVFDSTARIYAHSGKLAAVPSWISPRVLEVAGQRDALAGGGRTWPPLAFSESVSPLLDPRITGFFQGVAVDARSGGGEAIMRKAFRRALGPDVVQRMSHGGSKDPAEGALRALPGDVLETAILRGPLGQLLYLDETQLRAELEIFKRGELADCQGLWNAFTTALWLERHETLAGFPVAGDQLTTDA